MLVFLEGTVLPQKDQVKDLILLGDVFNTWVCPAKKAPPKYSEIFTANRPVLNMLKKIIKADIGLYYVNGNHDYDLDKATLQHVIPDNTSKMVGPPDSCDGLELWN